MSLTASRPQSHWTLEQWLGWQESLHPKTIALGLDRVRAVAQTLGLPACDIPTLTVGGTNGKGSSATLAALIYREAGYRTGLYTSPHLLRYNERIAIDGEPACDAELRRAFHAIELARGDVALTYFEFGTLAALWLFREAGVQVQVLEVGLGGRLDAVNIVDTDCALITNIGLDHTDWLGPDRESIASEKAGIARAGKPMVFVDPDVPEAIATVSSQLGAPLQQLGTDFYPVAEAGEWHWHGGETILMGLPPPGLRGGQQLRNAAGVLAAVQALQTRLPVAAEAIHRALPKLALQGRYQHHGRVILDVAHNAEAAQVLADNLREDGHAGIHLVLGMLADKPVGRVCAALAPLVRHAYCGSLSGPRGLDARHLAGEAQAAGMGVTACTDIPAAYTKALEQAGSEEIIVVTGSFLTVAAISELMHG